MMDALPSYVATTIEFMPRSSAKLLSSYRSFPFIYFKLARRSVVINFHYQAHVLGPVAIVIIRLNSLAEVSW